MWTISRGWPMEPVNSFLLPGDHVAVQDLMARLQATADKRDGRVDEHLHQRAWLKKCPPHVFMHLDVPVHLIYATPALHDISFLVE